MRKKSFLSLLLVLITVMSLVSPLSVIASEVPEQEYLTENCVVEFDFIFDHNLLRARSQNTRHGSTTVHFSGNNLTATLTYSITYDRTQGQLIRASGSLSNWNVRIPYMGMTRFEVFPSISGRRVVFNLSVDAQLHAPPHSWVRRATTVERIIQ
jgi:hypothetical protein